MDELIRAANELARKELIEKRWEDRANWVPIGQADVDCYTRFGKVVYRDSWLTIVE